MKLDLKKYTPPGMDMEREKNWFIVGFCCAVFYSMLFILDYFIWYASLWKYREMGEGRLLMPGAQMAPFLEILDTYLLGYALVAVCMLATVPVHYAYYRQGSKSIYLMRRLPDEKLLHRTCWTIPLMAVGLCAAAAAVSFVLYLAIYVFFTPPECIPFGQW